MYSNRLDTTARRRRARGPFPLVATCAALLTLPSMAAGQGTATLIGRVADSTGTALTHAVLRVSGLLLTVLTDANGGYRAPMLPASKLAGLSV